MALPECVFVLNHVLELSVQVFIHKIVAGVIKFAATKKIGADMDLPEKWKRNPAREKRTVFISRKTEKRDVIPALR